METQLSADELAEVLQAENRADLLIGGVVNNATHTIIFGPRLWRRWPSV